MEIGCLQGAFGLVGGVEVARLQVERMASVKVAINRVADVSGVDGRSEVWSSRGTR